MIGRIRGLLIEKKPPVLCVDVHGIGFEILAPLSTCTQLPNINQEVVLFTEFVVREDAQILYGFSRESDRALFKKIIKINGIGPKLALGILSGMTPDTFAHCVQQDDLSSLTKLPGVGKKTAERILIELRDKLQDWLPSIDNMSSTVITADSEQKAEAIAALEALGYKPKEAANAVAKAYKSGKTTEQIIKDSLIGS